MKIERRHVNSSYNEIDRRIQHMINDGTLETEDDIHDQRNAMLQGLYSTFMMIADNWPAVRQWCDTNERDRGYYEEV